MNSKTDKRISWLLRSQQIIRYQFTVHPTYTLKCFKFHELDVYSDVSDHASFLSSPTED